MKFIITAGPAREPIDPVRYLSNRSSGKMGFTLAGTAAKAVIELFVRIDAERGCLFVVEGAAGGVVLAGLSQLHTPINHIDDVDAIQKIVQKSLWNKSGHGVPLCSVTLVYRHSL